MLKFFIDFPRISLYSIKKGGDMRKKICGDSSQLLASYKSALGDVVKIEHSIQLRSSGQEILEKAFDKDGNLIWEGFLYKGKKQGRFYCPYNNCGGAYNNYFFFDNGVLKTFDDIDYSKFAVKEWMRIEEDRELTGEGFIYSVD